MLCQPLKFHERLVRRKESLLAHSHQDADRRRKRDAEQLARIDPILVIDAQNTSFLRESQDDRLRFPPTEAKVCLHLRNELLLLDSDNSDSRFIQRFLNHERIQRFLNTAAFLLNLKRNGNLELDTTQEGIECLRLTTTLWLFRPQFHEPFHGSMISRPQSSKSATLRVASLAPRTWAMAAICASAWLIGLPSARRFAAILENTRAASLSNAKMRPAKSSANTASAAATSPSRRLPFVSSSIP